jgi:aspartate dehydrogenase
VNLGLIGYGAIATLTLETLARALPEPLVSIVCCAKPEGVARARALLASFGDRGASRRHVVTTLDALLAARPDLVAEAAGQEAVRAHGAEVLAGGCDLVVTSVGALADEDLHARLRQAANEGGARLIISPGAIGAIDMLSAARLAGLDEVIYTSRKPPGAWRGTPAESLIALDTIAAPTVFYDGPARAAARDYPQNANVAATVALAGLGFERTRVRLIADPATRRNVHELKVRSACADMTFQIEGHPIPGNPKTSMTTGYSLARIILDRAGIAVP